MGRAVYSGGLGLTLTSCEFLTCGRFRLHLKNGLQCVRNGTRVLGLGSAKRRPSWTQLLQVAVIQQFLLKCDRRDGAQAVNVIPRLVNRGWFHNTASFICLRRSFRDAHFDIYSTLIGVPFLPFGGGQAATGRASRVKDQEGNGMVRCVPVWKESTHSLK